jgi:hypothetical protein
MFHPLDVIPTGRAEDGRSTQTARRAPAEAP